MSLKQEEVFEAFKYLSNSINSKEDQKTVDEVQAAISQMLTIYHKKELTKELREQLFVDLEKREKYNSKKQLLNDCRTALEYKERVGYVDYVAYRYGDADRIKAAKNTLKSFEKKHETFVKKYGSLTTTQSTVDNYDEREKENHNDDYFPESADISANCYEGAVSEILVNKYERNPVAREKCIQYYGAFCLICGFDFEKVYGAIGKDFIHVHHIVPISQIGAEYEVDYKKDLMPVCPNCHAMLHRKINGKTLSPGELRETVRARKDNV